MSDRTATVARFRSSRTAQVVFTARHGAGWRVCFHAAPRDRLEQLPVSGMR